MQWRQQRFGHIELNARVADMRRYCKRSRPASATENGFSGDRGLICLGGSAPPEVTGALPSWSARRGGRG